MCFLMNYFQWNFKLLINSIMSPYWSQLWCLGGLGALSRWYWGLVRAVKSHEYPPSSCHVWSILFPFLAPNDDGPCLQWHLVSSQSAPKDCWHLCGSNPSTCSAELVSRAIWKIFLVQLWGDDVLGFCLLSSQQFQEVFIGFIESSV